MTEEQRAKYGTAHYDKMMLSKHMEEKFVDIVSKEHGVTIKIKTLEEQKKEEEERIKKDLEEKERKEKAEAEGKIDEVILKEAQILDQIGNVIFIIIYRKL